MTATYINVKDFYAQRTNECANIAYSLDWSNHSIGTPDKWPQSLSSTLSILFNSKFPMFLWWGDDFICFYNDAYRPSLGNVGRHPAMMGEKGKVAWPDIWELIYPEIEDVINGGESKWYEDRLVPILRNNQMEDVYWTYSYSPVIGEKGKVMGVLVTCNETTKKIVAEKDLLKLTSQLELNAKALSSSNEELKQFAYIASHDLNEPLRMISNYLELLQKKYQGQLDESARKYIGFALDAAVRLKSLVQNLLEYSSIDAKPECGSVNLNNIITGIQQYLQPLIDESKAIIKVECLPQVKGNELQLWQLFQNLISNAIKYRSEHPPEIEIGHIENDFQWKFYVKDNGIGIDKKFFEKIFIILQRLHNNKDYKGTGIGLAICKKIVELHGGKIWLSSSLENGSTFYFTIDKIQSSDKAKIYCQDEIVKPQNTLA